MLVLQILIFLDCVGDPVQTEKAFNIFSNQKFLISLYLLFLFLLLFLFVFFFLLKKKRNDFWTNWLSLENALDNRSICCR